MSRSIRRSRASDQASRRDGWRARWRSAAADERGDVAPTVILSGASVLLVMLVIQLGIFFHARSVMNAAAQDGARAAQVEGATEADARAAAAQILAGSSNLIEDQAVVVSVGGDTITVTITGRVQTVFPGWRGDLTSSASGPVERFRNQAER
jgi:Flp pilus assembly protein TadG